MRRVVYIDYTSKGRPDFIGVFNYKDENEVENCLTSFDFGKHKEDYENLTGQWRVKYKNKQQ